MHNEGCGLFRLQVATVSMCEALIAAYGSFYASISKSQQREDALVYLEYAPIRM